MQTWEQTEAVRETDIQTDSHTDIQAYMQTDRSTYRH